MPAHRAFLTWNKDHGLTIFPVIDCCISTHKAFEDQFVKDFAAGGMFYGDDGEVDDRHEVDSEADEHIMGGVNMNEDEKVT